MAQPAVAHVTHVRSCAGGGTVSRSSAPPAPKHTIEERLAGAACSGAAKADNSPCNANA
jgi:hypothetical protein